MSRFLIDLEFSKKYEEHFAELLDLCFLNSRCDDEGVDLYRDNIFVDVKCYSKPVFVKSFNGVFLETFRRKSKTAGWYCDDTKKTTHYLFVIDCDRYNIDYKEAIYISRRNLVKCVVDCRTSGFLEYKQPEKSDFGIIVPYDFLKKYCDFTIKGDVIYEKEK